MLKLKQALIVEGRYDKNTLSQLVDGIIVDVGGFAIFNDKQKQDFLRRLAADCGVIIFTDSDGAGFVIRNFLKGMLPPEQVLHAYIPDIYGKERRKRSPSAEGKLGVEGMTAQVIYDALRRAGATLDEQSQERKGGGITKAQLFTDGLIGANSTALRKRLLTTLSLPEHLSTNALVNVLNQLYSLEEYHEAVRQAKQEA